MQLELMVVMVMLVGIMAWHEARIRNAEKAIRWFAGHIRYSREELENDPIPEDLAQYVIDLMDTDDSES